MPNRHTRRAKAAKGRGEAVQLAAQFLAILTDEAISGGTLFLPDGEVLCLSRDEASAIAGVTSAGGEA